MREMREEIEPLKRIVEERKLRAQRDALLVEAARAVAKGGVRHTCSIVMLVLPHARSRRLTQMAIADFSSLNFNQLPKKV